MREKTIYKTYRVSHFGHWVKMTIGAIFRDRDVVGHTRDKTISQFQSLCTAVFSMHFGQLGAAFVAIAVMLFAFSTVLGWSHYGTKVCEFLFGEKYTIVYRVIFVIAIFGGAVMGDNLAWDLADTFNGLMMIPNLIGVLVLSPLAYRITRNYVDRVRKGKKIKPMLSAFPDVQAEQEKNL